MHTIGVTRTSANTKTVPAIAVALALIVAACSGGDGESDSTQATIQGETIVVDQEELEAARAQLDDDAEQPDLASAAETDVPEPAEDEEPASSDDADGIEVAEAEEDELDGLLNAVTVFNACLGDEGFEFIGAPGQDGASPEDFDQGYIAALGRCATQSNILDAFQSFGAAQANLTPEEIEQNNFGLPVFKECMEGLGWDVEELVPDSRGALGFGQFGTGLTPPDGSDALDFDDINTCRATAEKHVEENYIPDESAET